MIPFISLMNTAIFKFSISSQVSFSRCLSIFHKFFFQFSGIELFKIFCYYFVNFCRFFIKKQILGQFLCTKNGENNTEFLHTPSLHPVSLISMVHMLQLMNHVTLLTEVNSSLRLDKNISYFLFQVLIQDITFYLIAMSP